MLIAGYDDANGPELYYMDWLAALSKVSWVVYLSLFKSLVSSAKNHGAPDSKYVLKLAKDRQK